MIDIIDISYTTIDISNLIPSFFEFLFGGALGLNNGSIFGTVFLLAIVMMSFLIFKPFGIDKAMITSSLISAIVGLLFLKVGWINNGIFVLTLIYFGGAMYYLFKETSAVEP